MRAFGRGDGVDRDDAARCTTAPAHGLPQVLKQAQDQQCPEAEENASRDEGKRVSAHRSSVSFECAHALVTIRASPKAVNAFPQPAREHRTVGDPLPIMSATLSILDASRYARIALADIERELPAKLDHAIGDVAA